MTPSSSPVRAWLLAHSSGLLVAAVVFLCGGLAAVQMGDLFPLTGQATPSYGPLRAPRVAKSTSSARSRPVMGLSPIAGGKVSSATSRATQRANMRGAAPESKGSSTRTSKSSKASSVPASSSLRSSRSSLSSVPTPVRFLRSKASSSSAAKTSSAAPVASSSRPSSAPTSSVRPVSSAQASSAWTGKECNDGKSDGCKAKMRAMLQGDRACADDVNCYLIAGSLRYEDACKKDLPCAAISIALRVIQTMPECERTYGREQDITACASTVDAFVSASLPAATKECMNSVMCRELFFQFRGGSFNCRRFDPCLAALDALKGDTVCAKNPVCSGIAEMHRLYTDNAQKCLKIETPECHDIIGISRYKVRLRDRERCSDGNDCMSAITTKARELERGNSSGSDCFLWPECKEDFRQSVRWACETMKREPNCTQWKGVWDLLTVNRPSCVNTAGSATCQYEMNAIFGR